MSYDYSENILVQESAGNLLHNELGWDVQFAYNTETLGKEGTFGRISYNEILLFRYFKEALKEFNPWINDSQISEAQKILEQRLSTSSLLQINEEKYFLIRDGIPVTVKKPNGQTETKKATVIDFQNPEKNYFLAIKELKIHGDLYRRRTDIVGFVNGIPLLFVELKKNTVDVQNAYDDNYTDYLDTIPHLFYYNAFLMPITSNQETRRFDISAIDFGLLRTEFAKVKRKNLVMRDLEEIIQQKLDRMLFTNPERINYYERYQQIIMGYNAEQDRATIEKTFMDLMDLANQMNQEEQRYAREGFSSDEELSLYDMLFRDDLSKNDIKKLKEVATTLLRKIKNRIAEIDHWTDKQETKAEIDNLIRNILYDELPLCYDEISISTYRQRIYEYVYTRYKSVA